MMSVIIKCAHRESKEKKKLEMKSHLTRIGDFAFSVQLRTNFMLIAQHFKRNIR